jgi:hypothetical protein
VHALIKQSVQPGVLQKKKLLVLLKRVSNNATMSLVTLECLDDGNTIDVPVDKTVIGRGSFLKVFFTCFC